MSAALEKSRAQTLAVEIDEKKIDAIFANLNQSQQPGAAVGVAVNGRPVYRKAFGLASMELPVTLSPGMRMRIGSTSKHFTAFAYMLLCEQGKANLDDPLKKYLPELHPVTHRVTMRQLMNNTSGLRDAIDIRFQFSGPTGRKACRDDILSLYSVIADVNAPPGKNWIYNNGGWVLLSVVIERLTGQSFEEAMRTLVFEPVGMADTLVRPWDTNFIQNSATPHSINQKGEFERLYWDVDFAGAGTIMSSVNDMLRWAAHMDSPRVGSIATWDVMKTPQVLANGVPTGYGLGLMRNYYRGVEVIYHAGGGIGCNAQMLKVPAAGLDIVVMVNRGDVAGASLADQIVNACVPDLDPSKEAPLRFATGIFRSPTSGQVIELASSGGKQIVSIDGMDQPFEMTVEGRFRPAIDALQINREIELIGDQENPRALRLNDFGNRDELARLEPIEAHNGSAIVGRYRSEETGCEVSIAETADGPHLYSAGPFGRAECRLECLALGVWRARTMSHAAPPCAVLAFNEDHSGFGFSNFVNRSLQFRRGI